MKAGKTLHIGIAALAGTLASCASITVVPLKADGTKASTEEGVRYYLPKPYLLITELPVAPQAAAPAASTAGAAPPGGGGPQTQNSTQQSSTSQPQTAAPSSTSADTSFSATMASYAVKLIYLPDYSQPMSIQLKSGVFGNSSSAPTLQDGWMLTSMSGSADSGGAAVISALTSLGSAFAGGAGPAAAKGGTQAAVAPGDQTLLPKSLTGAGTALKDYSPSQLVLYGQSVGEGTLKAPPAADIDSLTKPQLSLFVTAIAAGAKAQAQTSPKQVAPSVTWGPNVLPAGLYEFVFDTEKHLTGLKAVMYFCITGPLTATADRPATCAR